MYTVYCACSIVTRFGYDACNCLDTVYRNPAVYQLSRWLYEIVLSGMDMAVMAASPSYFTEGLDT